MAAKHEPGYRIPPRDPPINVRLRRLRQRRALDIEFVRGIAGWPPGHLESLESGVVAPLLSEVIALAWLYRIDLDHLLPRAGRAIGRGRNRESGELNRPDCADPIRARSGGRR